MREPDDAERHEDEILAELAAERLREITDAIPVEDLPEFNE